MEPSFFKTSVNWRPDLQLTLGYLDNLYPVIFCNFFSQFTEIKGDLKIKENLTIKS